MPWGRGPRWVVPARQAGGWDRPWTFGRRPAQPAPERLTRHVRAELDKTAAVQLNSIGAGYATLAPDGTTWWEVEQVEVSTSSGPTDSSTISLYRSGVFPHKSLGRTAQGGGDTLSWKAKIRPGDTVICLWQDGNPGDFATVTLTGVVHALVI